MKDQTAVGIGHFKAENRKHTIAFRFSRLFKLQGHLIVEVVFPHLDSDKIIITTYRKDDIAFKDYIVDEYKKNKKIKLESILIKRDTNDTPTLLNNLFPHTQKITGKDVIFVISTVSEAINLRNLISLLVEKEC